MERFEEAIAATRDELVRAEALVALGELLLQMGDLARARPRLEEVARLGRGPEAPRARAMLMLGLSALLRRDRETAEAELGRSLDAFQRLRNGYGVGGTLDVLAGVAVRNADPVRRCASRVPRRHCANRPARCSRRAGRRWCASPSSSRPARRLESARRAPGRRAAR